MDASLYIGSLLVGGIAGLTLTSTAFQRPQKLMEQYEKRCDSLGELLNNARSNPAMGGRLKDAARKSSGAINLGNILKTPLPLIGIFTFELLEIVVMLLFLFAEVALLLVYFASNPGDQNILSAAQSDLLTKGYVLIFFAILAITTAHVLALTAASEEFRRRRRLLKRNIEITDVTSQEQLYALLIDENYRRPIA